MIKRRRFPKIFPGWWMVVASGILSFWGYGYYQGGFSAMFKTIASELGFSRAATSVAASIARLEGGFEGVVVGWLIDRFGPKWLAFFGVFLLGLGLILMYFISSLWSFYVVWGVIAGMGANIGLGLPLNKAIADWFVKKRGIAVSIRWMFVAPGELAILPLVTWLIATEGWRLACMIGGVVMWLVGLPLVLFFVKERRPEYYGLLPDGATVKDSTADESQMIERGVKYAGEVQEVEFTVRQAMRTSAYWLLIVAQAGQGMVVPFILIHRIPFLTDVGFEPLKAAAVMGAMVTANIPGTFVGGLITDRLRIGHLRFLLAGTYLLQAASIAAYLMNQTTAMIYVLFTVWFVGMGLMLSPNTVVRARYFGRKAFGSIQGTSMMITAPFGVIAPIYAGWVYDTTGSYITVFVLVAGLLALAAVLISLARPPKPPVRVTDIRKIV